MSIKRIFAYGVVCIAASQTRPAPPDEVRIRSAIYSPPTLTLAAQANLVELAVSVRLASLPLATPTTLTIHSKFA